MFVYFLRLCTKGLSQKETKINTMFPCHIIHIIFEFRDAFCSAYFVTNFRQMYVQPFASLKFSRNGKSKKLYVPKGIQNVFFD